MPALPPPPGHLTAEALQALLGEVLAVYDPEFSASVDEVVVTVEAPRVLETARLLHDEPRLSFDYLRSLSGVDWTDRLEVVYHVYSTAHRHRLTLKARTPVDRPQVPSVVLIWRGADWHEREAAEMYGLTFEGHPNLVELLLWEGAPVAPQRKDVPVLSLEEFWKDMGLEEEEEAPAPEAPAAAPRRLTAREQKQRLLAEGGGLTSGPVPSE